MLSSRVSTLKRLFFCSPIWAALLGIALAGSTFAAPRRAQFQALPLERSGQNHLLLRAFINGKPALLAVDSGAPVSAVAIERVEHFGMKLARGVDGPARRLINGRFSNVALARGLRLGSLNLIDQPMVALDLGGSARAAEEMDEEPIDGILGADIMFPTDAVLDCRAQVLILKIDPEVQGGLPGLDYSGFSSVPIHVTRGDNLYVESRVNGKRARLMVDTGAFATLLHRGFIRQMKIPLRDAAYTSSGVNIKQGNVQLALINRFSIGSVQMRRKEVGVTDLGGLLRKGLDATPPVAGLLGSEILRRHNGIIDFRTRTLYLKR